MYHAARLSVNASRVDQIAYPPLFTLTGFTKRVKNENIWAPEVYLRSVFRVFARGSSVMEEA